MLNLRGFFSPALRRLKWNADLDHSLIRHEAVITVKWMYDYLHENDCQEGKGDHL
jgi:hypothetical protein